MEVKASDEDKELVKTVHVSIYFRKNVYFTQMYHIP